MSTITASDRKEQQQAEDDFYRLTVEIRKLEEELTRKRGELYLLLLQVGSWGR